MALSKTLPNTTVSPEVTPTTAATAATVEAPVPAESRTVPATPAPTPIPVPAPAVSNAVTVGEDDLKLDGLYNSASNLEVELEGIARRGTVALTSGQVGAFNSILKLARQLVPNSVALREDVDDIDLMTRPADAHQALHVTIVPTLHNALPEPLYNRH